MVSGAAGPLVAPGDLDDLARRLAAGGAAVEPWILPAVHRLAARDGALVEAWLQRKFPTA